ncbi:hypothetical protein J4730_19615 [Klebsiella pneumoniae]|uniref:Hydroxyaromatic non-oxidative decarboxylase protein D n=1 Tax=Klebsiella pneumoniae TaxID=573 RepID=A0A939NIS2_KLEPN|nr:hypothetical protein [Klebsiella pneumoniae]
MKGVWTVYQCQHCLYTARYRAAAPHQPRTLSEAFRMTQKDIDEAPQVPHAAAIAGR